MKVFTKICMLGLTIVAGLLTQEVYAGSVRPVQPSVTRVCTESSPQTHESSRLRPRTSSSGEILDMTSRRSDRKNAPRRDRKQNANPRMSRLNSGDNAVTLWGNVIYASSWEESGEYSEGIYSFPAEGNTTLTPVQVNSDIYAVGGGVFDENRFKFVSYLQYSDGSIHSAQYCEYDTQTWENITSQTLDPSQYDVIANVIARDPVSGRYYGMFPAATSGTEFGYVDYNTMTKTIIAPCENLYVAMAINSLGEIYAICQYGDLYKIDKATGDAEYIGETGVYPQRILQSMAFDLDTNRLYWAAVLINGKSWLCEVDTEYGEMSKISDLSDNEEIVCLYVPRKAADEGAPARVDDLNVITDKASTTVTVEFTMPCTTFGGSELTGELGYEIQGNAQSLAVGNANAGERVSVNVEVPAGEIKFTVTASNSVGKGEPTSVTKWIGYDVPKPVTNLKFEIDETAGESVVSWNASEGGVHDAYIENVTYDVTRYPGAEVVATGLETTQWREARPIGNIQEYYYEVVAVNGDQRSDVARTNSLITGDSYGVPYFCGFDSEAAFDEFTVLDMNHDERTWVFNSGYNAISYTYSSENVADDWALTPEIKFLSSTLYNVSLKARSVSASYPEKVSVWVGKGLNPDEYECVIPTTVLDGSEWQTLSENFRIPADGGYRIGIKAESDAAMLQLQVDDISITANGTLDTPGAATNISITPASKGELKATVTFNAPAVTVNGDELNMLDKVVLYNGDRVVDELPAAPGQSCYMVDYEPTNGFNTYTIRAFNENGAGEAIRTEAYIGFDVPLAPADVNVSLKDDHASIEWTAPGQTGENGGYVNPDDLTYTLYVVTIEGYVQLVKEGIVGTTYDDYSREFTGVQDMISYCVTASNPGGEGERGSSDDVIIIGTPYSAPFFESFAKGEFRNPLWWGTRTGDSGFVKDIGSDDRDGGCVAWTPNSADDECWLNTGKISLDGMTHPVLSFSYKHSKDACMSLDVQLQKEDKELVTLKSLESSIGDGEWNRIIVDLSDFKNDKYIVLKFHGMTECQEKGIFIDRIRIDDMSTHNLSTEVCPVSKAVCGENVSYRVKVFNLGQETADSYLLALYSENNKVAEVEGVPVASMDEQTMELNFRAPLESGSMTIFAEVTDDADVKSEDNRSAEVVTELVESAIPSPGTLRGNVTAQGVELTWDSPEYSDVAHTEGFEDYDAWTADTFGLWTTGNGNQGLTYGMKDVHFPQSGHVFAYTVFNPYDLGFDPEYAPQLAAYSGSQFALAMSDYGFDQNDKWLISPRLSGKSQSISFFASGLSDFYAESFRVMYSVTGNSVADFTEVTLTESNVQSEWKKYSVSLPEGARYFAIHYNSAYGLGLRIDDITYVPGYELTGYNIYRNDEMIGNVPANRPAYTDSNNSDGKYLVTACYDEGESTYSNVYEAQPGGIIDIDSCDDYYINGGVGNIFFKSATPKHVRITDVSGTLYRDETVDGGRRFTVPAGIYVITVDDDIHKVIVR